MIPITTGIKRLIMIIPGIATTIIPGIAMTIMPAIVPRAVTVKIAAGMTL